MKNQKNIKKGFTLIELLVVVAILGVLASMITVSLNRARISARDAKRIAEINQMRKAVEVYYLNHDAYPQVNDTNIATGWSSFIQYLRGDGILASEDYRKSFSLNDFSRFFVPSVAFALVAVCPANVSPQDPQCECQPGNPNPSSFPITHSYGFISSAGQGWQYYKLRTKLENTNHSVLRSGLSGDFAQVGDNGCDFTQGYYCVGDSNLIPI